MALWLDSLKFCGRECPREACGFVIINSQLHDEFDRFKSKLDSENSYLEFVELLQFWCNSQKPQAFPLIAHKYGKQYIVLQATEVDNLVAWVEDTRDLFEELQQGVFQVRG